MTQSSMIVSGGNGATVRADINTNLQALASTSKGSNPPSTLYPGQLWVDDNTPSSTVWTLYLYDGSESIALATIDTTNNTTAISPAAVGIGTSSPIRPLTISSSTSAEAVLQDTSQGTDQKNVRMLYTGGLYIIGSLNDAGNAGTGVFYVDPVNGRAGVGGTPNTHFEVTATGGARIRASGGTGSGFEFGGANASLRLVGTQTLGLFTSGFERFRVDSVGHMAINQSATATPGVGNTTLGGTIYNDGVNGMAYIGSRASDAPYYANRNSDGPIFACYRSGVGVGGITVTTTATAYNTSSDYRLKENLAPLDGALERLGQIPVYRGNFKATPEVTQDMILAHELAAILPQAVTGEKDAVDADGNPVMQSVDLSKSVPLLIAAVQELAARVAQLEGN